ncbi:UDP-N-acetylmuramate dehydrogenase [Lapidilactobacillus achengensis]|uniref:UDP-N-acetylenolpyruvoylglucosamine reductase n=1 Tax=Lapidilactobacillus achengensis TaxID=2486000 RepID=A0ABW1UR94_9LACO|nr:UDP-N-acetylmuramate dehydrogenase [Lapidilactobacillus achengensis]
MLNSLFSDLNIPIQANAPMSDYTFTRTGGPAELLAFPETESEVAALVQRAYQKQIPVTIIGNASNLIIRDGGLAGLVILLTRIDDIRHEGLNLVASAGAPLMAVSEAAYQFGLTGLEFAAGIPGSVGGAVFMNAGAYSGEVSDVITSINVLDERGNLRRISGANLHFSYRHSVIQEQVLTVLSATFALRPGERRTIRQKMDELNAARASHQPLELPSCGSVFKRPPDHYTAPLIREAGLQGKIIGGAQVSLKHAGFIVNIDQATATDYLRLIALIQQTVWAKFQVRLETEVRIIGREPETISAQNAE